MDHAGVDAIVIDYVFSYGCELLALQRVRKLQEQAAISNNAISGVQSGLNLGLSLNAVPESDGAPAKLFVSRLNINERLVLTVPQYGGIRHCNGVLDRAGIHRRHHVHI